MKNLYKNWFKGFALLLSLSLFLAGIESCSPNSNSQELLVSDLVTLRILGSKTAQGNYRFFEYKTDSEPLGLKEKTVAHIEGFDILYKPGTEYIISARKYTNERDKSVSYNYISILSSYPAPVE